MEPSPKKVLIFAPYFVPRPRVGALRPYRFAKYLSNIGWKVVVVSIKDSKHTLNAEYQDALKKVKLIELEPPFDRTQTAGEPAPKAKSQKKSGSSIADWFDNQFPLDTWLPFFYMKKKEIRRIFEEEKPDVIWSTSDPWSGGYIAGKIAQKAGIPWVADFRDPWTLCSVRFPKKGNLASVIDQKSEQWMMENADFITFTAKATERKYMNFYSTIHGTTDTLYNSFDLDLHELLSTPAAKEKNEKLNILFLGTFRELSTAELIIEVLSKIKEKNPEVLSKVFIHSYGPLKGRDAVLAKVKGVLDRFIEREKVPNTEIQSEFDGADLLLLSTQPERDDIVPAKLFDYLISGKPVLSLVQNQEVGDILNKTGTGKQYQRRELDKAADHIIKSVLEGPHSFSPNKEAIQQYDAYHRAMELSEILNSVAAHGRR